MATVLDPVTLEVIRNTLPAISDEMAIDLHRTSYNMMIYEVRDFCTALIDPDGNLVSQNVGGVSHFVADLGVIITDVMKRYGADGIDDGDVFIMNHQAVAGQHLNNVVIYTPCFFEGELVMFSMVRAHWVDVGGSSTGFGAGARTTEPWLEGLQLNQLKIYKKGEPDRDLHQIIADNIRFPEASFGDMRSQIAACRLGGRRIVDLLERYGTVTVKSAIERIFADSERKCRTAVEAIPDGVYEAESFYDGPMADGSARRNIKVTVTVDGGSMTIDFSRCDPESYKFGLNCRSLAPGLIAYRAITTPRDPVNEGSIRACKLIVPEGSYMMARYPAPMASWGTTFPTVVDTVLKALAQAIPDRIPAAHHALLGGAAVFFGRKPDTGERFVLQDLEGGGWGGRPFEDGESGSVSICQGDVRNGSIEGLEIQSPVIIEERSLRQDSGGAGKFRGGLGIDLRVRNRIEGFWNFNGHYRIGCPPWGANGGKPGATAHYFLKQPGENDFKEMSGARHPVPPDCEVIVRTGGGGGWGDPFQRDVALVVRDVADGVISRAGAERDFGVAVTDDLTVDEARTQELRAAQRT